MMRQVESSLTQHGMVVLYICLKWQSTNRNIDNAYVIESSNDDTNVHGMPINK